MLCQTYMKKGEIVRNVILKSGQIKLKVSDPSLLYDLRRRLKQQKQCGDLDLTSRSKNELNDCYCYNDSNLSWEATFDRIIDMENSNDQQQPLSCDKLMAIAEILSENVVTTQRELEHVSTSDEILQIIKLMPIMLLTKKDRVCINLHEFLFTSGVLEAFLLSAEPLDEEPIVLEPTAIESIQPEDLDRKSVGGQPAITTNFPEIADIA